MCSFSAHEGKIVIFEKFHCSLTNIIWLNWHLVKLIRKIEICSISANFCKTHPRLPLENQQKMPILLIFCTISPKQTGCHSPPLLNQFLTLISLTVNDLKYVKKLQKSINRNFNYNWKHSCNTKTSPFMCVTIVMFLCPFLLKSPRLNLKLLWKLGIYSKLLI